jgi:hypothetical protein
MFWVGDTAFLSTMIRNLLLLSNWNQVKCGSALTGRNDKSYVPAPGRIENPGLFSTDLSNDTMQLSRFSA